MAEDVPGEPKSDLNNDNENRLKNMKLAAALLLANMKLERTSNKLDFTLMHERDWPSYLKKMEVSIIKILGNAKQNQSY